MKKIKIEVNMNVDKVRKKVLAKYQNDQFFIDNYHILKSQNLDFDLVDAIEVIESKRICLDCDSLEDCKQSVKGHCLSLSNGLIEHSVCQYLLRINDLENRYKNLIYTTLNITKEFPSYRDLDITKARIKVAKYFKLLANGEVDKGMFLSGPTGVGKTFIVESLLSTYMMNGFKCAYITLNDFFNEMKAMYFSYDNDDKNQFNRTIQRLKTVNILIIDDIGSEKVDAISRDDILFPILDYRMKNKKLTHFTSNYTLEMLEHHYTETTTKSSEPVKAKRLMERIRVLSELFLLNEEKSRR